MSTLWQSHTFTLLLEQPGETITPFLAYDPVLSRIRVDEAVVAEIEAGAALNVNGGVEDGSGEPLNVNPGAEVDTAGWLAFGGALERSTAQAHAGVASVLFTPAGGFPAAAIENTFESGLASGTVITTGNSGGGAGRAFDTVNGSPTFDNTHVHNGSLAMRCPMSGGDAFVRWLDGVAQATGDTYVRFYAWFDALPSVVANLSVITTTINGFKGRLRITTTGLLEWVDNTSASMCITTIPVATGQWVRIEGRLTTSATTASAEIRLYNSPESTTATESVASAAAFNTLADNPAGWRWGVDISGTAPDVVWLDDVAADPDGWIGPGPAAPGGDGGVIELSAPTGSAAAGERYRVAAWVYSPDGYAQVRVRVQFLDAGGGFLSSENGTTTAIDPGVWTFLVVSGTAPASTSRVAPVVDMLGSPTSSDLLYVDDLQATAVPTEWVTSNSTIVRSTLFAHSGVASIEVTPNGVNVTNSTGSTAASSPAASPGIEYQVSAWVYSPLGWPEVHARIQWLDASDAVIGADVDGPIVSAPAGVWTFVSLTATAPALTAKLQGLITQTGSAPAEQLFYVDDFVITDDVHVAGPVPAGAVRVVERSTDLLSWTTVRGGAELPVDGGANPLSDWEFAANSENHYRIRVLVEGELYWTWRDSVSVVLDRVWIKPVRRPFLSRVVTVTEHGDVQRTSRSGVFPIAGRGLPVAVVDLHESQRWTLELMTIGQPEAREMDLIAASGDVFFVHGPPDCPMPEGYYVLGDLTRARRSTRGERRYHTLPLTMVAGPAAELEGVTFTWRGALNRWATWADVAAEGLSWAEIDELIGTIDDVVVS